MTTTTYYENCAEYGNFKHVDFEGMGLRNFTAVMGFDTKVVWKTGAVEADATTESATFTFEQGDCIGVTGESRSVSSTTAAYRKSY